MSTAVVAEKPSVARDIAAVLGANRRGEGCFEGGGYVVTWAIGHLVKLAEPGEIEPAWKRWTLGALPMLPKTFPLVVVEDTKDQFAIVKKILKSKAIDDVICATDAGREGELIFRYVYEAADCKKKVRRLWISSLTPDAIRDGFQRLKSSSEYDRLADAARGRSRADWLVGMNLSRAYSLVLDQNISVGRVQTPTLAILVDRELAIRSFVPEDYLEVVATFGIGLPHTDKDSSYEGVWTRPRAAHGDASAESANQAPADDLSLRRRLPFDGEEAARIVERAKRGRAEIASVRKKAQKLDPPLLYDLTELQRHANRLYGFSAQRTLDVAQSLYERHKLISYPRTDSRHLSSDLASTLEGVTRAIEHRYPGLIAEGTGVSPLGRRFVDDARVTDHHAIIPTTSSSASAKLSSDEQKLYDLICRRLLQAWHEQHVVSITHVVTHIVSSGAPPLIDRYESQGSSIEQMGWKVLDIGGGRRSNEPVLPGGLAEKQKPKVLEAKSISKRTRPPPRHSDATLLTAMETAGRALEEKELSDAMRDLGLGTPATRAQIIETLIKREYVVREDKSLEATDKGIGLVSVVHPEVKSPAMTGEWEAKLRRLQRGEGDLKTFMRSIEEYVTEVVGRASQGVTIPTYSERSASISLSEQPTTDAPPLSKAMSGDALKAPSKTKTTLSNGSTSANSSLAAPTKPRALSSRATNASSGLVANGEEAASPSAIGQSRAPTAPEDLRDLLESAFGFAQFRPYQEAVCKSATIGRDLLLVMPTGAGKSLCYQLPGVARGGTTLVISPLIALMEDQATKLAKQGFRAERIHSGRSRSESRAACVDYLAGRLDFLFIAPERLKVPGFPEMLAKRKPSLIAIDEAHCISQWGHDFRPDYRMLGQRLPGLRPAPIVALTATATPEVQKDIVSQLGLSGAKLFIHGFRRTNISVEVMEMSPGQRVDAVRELLAEPARRPAIVYAATRKDAEKIALGLGKKLASAYHAGMDAIDRDRVQSAFLEGRLEIIVATTAFGMGIDKADVRTIVHAALPASLEGYYQEIGRAGRDGEPSVAVLFYSFVDRKTHEFFHERDYPDPEILTSIHDKLRSEPVSREKLRKRLKIDTETFDKALEKLSIHGGAEVSLDDEVTRGNGQFLEPYAAQRAHKLLALETMWRFASSSGCRMVHMIRHFGDQEDAGEPCGLCDVCVPDRCVARRFRQPSSAEGEGVIRILRSLDEQDGQATGRLYRETFPNEAIERRSFEHLLSGLVRAGLVELSEASFEKGGESIRYQRASLTSTGKLRGAEMARVSIEDLPVARPKAGARSKSGKRPSPKGKAPRAKPSTKSASPKKPFAKTNNKWFFINKAKKKKRGGP